MGNEFERFKTLAAAYGGDRRRWPEAERGVYDAFAGAPQAQLILAGAQQVDHFLDQWHSKGDGDAMRERILAALPAQHAEMLRAPRWSLPVAIMMFVALLGFSNGYFAMDSSDQIGNDTPAAFGMLEEDDA